MKGLSIFAACAALVAVPAVAQERAIQLGLGDAVTLSLDGVSGNATINVRDQAEWNAFDVEQARDLVMRDAGPPNRNAVPITSNTPASPIASEALRLKFFNIAERHSLLVLENGFTQGLVYRARIYRHGQSQATDVCLVMPGRRGYEHWPYLIDRIELSAFRLVPWQPAQGIPCA